LFLLVPMAGMVWRAFTRSRDDWKVAQIIVLTGTLICFVNGLATSDYDYARHQRRLSQDLLRALRESGIYHGQTVYTDLHVACYDRWPGVPRVLFLANEAVRWEIEKLVKLDSPSYSGMLRALHRNGFLVLPEAHEVQPGAVYVLREGERMRRWLERIGQFAPQRMPLTRRFVVLFWEPDADDDGPLP
jgi:hypothetical protein